MQQRAQFLLRSQGTCGYDIGGNHRFFCLCCARGGSDPGCEAARVPVRNEWTRMDGRREAEPPFRNFKVHGPGTAAGMTLEDTRLAPPPHPFGDWWPHSIRAQRPVDIDRTSMNTSGRMSQHSRRAAAHAAQVMGKVNPVCAETVGAAAAAGRKHLRRLRWC